MSIRIGNPFTVFLDSRGFPLDGGTVYIGLSGADPEASPTAVYLDKDLSIPAPQPIAVIGGLLCYDGNPTQFYTALQNFSIRVRDRSGAQVFYEPNAVSDAQLWQPYNAELTAIAALATTPYGRQLLSMTTAAVARAYLGISDGLALTGGTVTGNITRSSGGPHLYHTDGAFSSGRVFVTASGAADPTSLPGDIWIERAA